MDDDGFIFRNLEPDGRLAALFFILGLLFFRQVAAFAHIAGHLAVLEESLPFFLQLFRRTVTIVGLPFLEQLVSIFLIDIEPLHLMVGAIRAAHVRPFIPSDTKPFQSGLNVFFRFRRRTFPVRIFNAQYEFTAHAFSQKPVEKRGTGAADVERASRARCKTYSHFFFH